MTTEPETPNGKPTISDSEIIERFGGIRPMASKLGVAVTTVQGWKERGHIPEGRLPRIIKAAATHDIDIGLEKAPAPEPAKPAEPKPVEQARPAERAPPEPAPEPEPAVEPAKEAAPAAAKPVAQPTPARGVSGLVLVIVVILLGGAIVTGPLWQAKLYPGGGTGIALPDTGRFDEIADGLARLEGSLEEIKRDLDAGDVTLSDRIDALEAGGGETGAAFAEQLAAVEKSLAALETGLSGIESRIAGLEATRGELPDRVKASLDETDAALGALRDEVGALTKAVGDQGQALRDDAASAGEAMAGLDARVAALETRPVQTGEKIAAMVLALGHVESGLNTGRPYRPALDRLETLGREDPLISGGEAIAALSTWADQGVPDRLALRRHFAELAPGIDRSLAGLEEASWLDSVWNSVTGLVTVRRIDGANLTPIGLAEQALEGGDLIAAAAAFEGKGSLGSEGDAWINLVRARIAAEHEIETLYGQMIAPLAGEGGDGGTAAQ
jgi:hypothetical protein